MVVLNTCCIRENADNKLYGTLGHLKSLKAARPGLEIVVGGCLAQKDRDLIRARAGHVDVVFGTHNVHRAVELLHAVASRRPADRDLGGDGRSTRPRPSPRPCPPIAPPTSAAWVTIQIGCDNSCAFCIVPAVRGREISRPFGELVAEVERAGRRRAWSRSPCSARTSTPTGATWPRACAAEPVGARRCRRGRAGVGGRSPPAGAAAVRRPAGGGRPTSRASGGCATPARTRRTCGAETIEAMAAASRGVPAPAPARCSPAATPCWPPCTAATPPSATSSAWRAARAADRRPGRHDRPHRRASRARPTTTSSARSRWRPRPPTTAPTRSSTRPGPAPRRPSTTDQFVPPDVVADRFERLRVVVERSGAGQAPGPDRAGRGGADRGPEQEGPGGAERAHRPEQAGPRAPTRPSRCAPAPSPTPASPPPARTT